MRITAGPGKLMTEITAFEDVILALQVGDLGNRLARQGILPRKVNERFLSAPQRCHMRVVEGLLHGHACGLSPYTWARAVCPLPLLELRWRWQGKITQT